MQSFIEQYRELAVSHAMGLRSFKDNFNSFQQSFQTYKPLTPQKYLNISQDLRDIMFKAGSTWLAQQPTPITPAEQLTLRQKMYSRVGNSWESMVTYYLNLGFIGSNAVVAKPAYKNVASCLVDATAVTHQATHTHTSEIDLYVVIFPPSDVASELYALQPKMKKNILLNEIKDHSEKYFNDIEIGALQLKSTWNDLAQSPTLWNIMYELARTNTLPNSISVGMNSWYLANLKKFSYSFLTLPTQKNLSTFRPTSTPVVRVSTLSGGNYWGTVRTPNVAKTISDIFDRYQYAFSGSSQRQKLANEIPKLLTDYSYFNF